MDNSVAKLKNSKVDWMAHITALAQSNCNKGFKGLWLKYAADVLHKNKINRFMFADALRTLMKKGRGKILQYNVSLPKRLCQSIPS